MVQKSILLLLLGFFYPFFAWPQYDHLLHKSYREKVVGVHEMYQDLIAISDSAKRDKKATEIKQFAQRHGDRALELEVQFFQVFWNSFYQKQPKAISLMQLKKQLDLLGNKDIDFLRERGLRALAEFYWKIEKNYELAFEQYLLLDNELATINAADYPEMIRDLVQIGEAYYFFQDYSIAKNFFKRAINLPETSFNTTLLNTARNSLGLCFQQTGELDSADYYFDKVRHTTFVEANVWKRIATGNKGTSMYLRKQYDLALPLVQTDFNGAVKENDHGCAAGAAILLADMYREKGKMAVAKSFITAARYHILAAGQPERLRLLYPVMSKWYAAAGDMDKSRQYTDSSITALKNYNEQFSALKLLRAQQKVDRQKEQLQQANFNLDKQHRINERNLITAIALILVIVLVLGYLILKKRRQAIEFAKLKIESELKIAKGEIGHFIYKINEQSKITERFGNELLKLKSSALEERKLLEQTLAELRTSRILTDGEWLSFQKHFGSVFQSFVPNLKTNYPAITDAEIRYLMLSKLQLSHKEMAQALGISADAVRVTWNRVRKKLGGKLEDTPQSLLEGI